MLEAQIAGSSTFGVSVIAVKVSTPPSSGKLSVSPSAGEALATKFTLTSQDWVSEELPLCAPASLSPLQLSLSLSLEHRKRPHSHSGVVVIVAVSSPFSTKNNSKGTDGERRRSFSFGKRVSNTPTSLSRKKQ